VFYYVRPANRHDVTVAQPVPFANVSKIKKPLELQGFLVICGGKLRLDSDWQELEEIRSYIVVGNFDLHLFGLVTASVRNRDD